ncbi:MAG: recombination protein O N-terminal domain-containing protein, partial [Bacteriovorax sp.]|nr:recombination protein O N-terminal domain-containing protein [Bacteriovorax sp.]
MQTKIEGIVLSKIPYDERHIIAHLLLRSGRKVSVVFYGGRGGGVKQKSSVIELGFMLSVELRTSKSTGEIYHAKEWNLVWHHDLVRLDHSAFYVMCFFLEIINKVSPSENLHEVHEENVEMVGLFTTLSNALVHLEKCLQVKSFYTHSHSVIF